MTLADTSPTDNVFGLLFPALPVSCSNYWCSSSQWTITHISSNFAWRYLQITCTCLQLSIFTESMLSITLWWLWHSSICCILVKVIKLSTCTILIATNQMNNIPNNPTWSQYLLQMQQHCQHANTTVYPQYVLQASICKYNTTYYSKFYKVMSTQSLHHHDYATVQSSIPWLTYDYCTDLLGIMWPMCISNHPTSDLLYTEHIIKYHPPNDSKLQYSPPHYPNCIAHSL